MGCTKAWLPFGTRPLIAAVLETLRPLFPEIRIIASDPAAYGGLGVDVRADAVPAKGPLGGIYTALRASAAERVFCIGCDMPLAHPDLIAYLCRPAPDTDVVVPRTALGVEPLCAVYGKGCLGPLEALLRTGPLRTDGLLARVRVREVAEQELRARDPSLHSFLNINTPADLQRALALCPTGRAPGGS
jgi:molybdopterin-guanine dinucleotide biosynthesis protein A